MDNPKFAYIGDLHLRPQKPYPEIFEKFMNVVLDSPINSKDYILFLLGDIGHSSKLDGYSNYLLVDYFFNKLKCKETIIVRGNHDLDYYNGQISDVTQVFDANPKITVIRKPTYLNREGKSFLIFPHYHSTEFPDLQPMKVEYSSEVDTYKNIPVDFLVHHVGDETQTLFNNFTDLSHIPSTYRIGGHIHKRVLSKGKRIYLGTPYITRYDEKGKDSYIATYQDELLDYDLMPRFVDYKDLEYGDTPPDYAGMIVIYDIKNAPSEKAVYDKYPDLHIREIFLKEYTTAYKVSENEDNIEFSKTEDIYELYKKENVLDEALAKEIELRGFN